MQIHLQFEAQLRRIAGAQSITLTANAPTNLPLMISGNTCPLPEELRGQLLDRDGRLRRSLLYFVNQQPVPAESLQALELRDGDTIMLCPPISGG